MHMAFFSCLTAVHEHQAAPTAILQLETQGIPGIANYGVVLCYLPHQSYALLFASLCTVGDNQHHFASKNWSGTVPAASLVRQWGGRKAENGSIQVRDPPPCVH